MTSYRRISCLIVCFLFILRVKALSQQFASESFSYPLQNLRTFNNKIYIGGTNMIYMLNKDLSISQSASTCNESLMSCRNINKIFIVLEEERQELLVCGTGNDGICEVRSTNDIGNVLRTSSEIKSPMKVSTDSSRPAQGVVMEDGNVMLAVSFGDGIDMKKSLFDYWTYDYAISTRNLINFETEATTFGPKRLGVDIVKEHLPKYIIYYKGVFQFNWFTYFVTNQKKTVTSTDYISKLTSVCQNNTDFKSYADIFLTCVYDGITYNLIQEATIIEAPDSFGLMSNDTIFVGAFTRGNDPTKVSGNTAICVSKLNDINVDILKAKQKYALSCEKQNSSERYLPDDLKFRDYDFSCESAYNTFHYVIGNVTHTITAIFLLDEVKGQVTALDGVAVNGENVVLVAGTSTGCIVQLSMTSLESSMEVFSTVELRMSIRRVHIQDDDTLYVLGSHKVYLFSRSTCSEFSSCGETMAARNPVCGWCFYKQRATRKSQCSEAPYHWRSSLYKCKPRVNLTPSNIPVTDSKRNNFYVNLTLEYLPTPRADDIFKCRLVDENNDAIFSDTVANRNGMKFSCDMPYITGHVELKLELFVQTILNESILLSEAPISFFECEKIRGCADCMDKSDSQCNWCTGAMRCQSRVSICQSGIIDSVEFCPHLSDRRAQHFAHAGQLTSIRFQGKHLPMSDNTYKYIYTCKTSSTSSNAVVENNSVFCSVNAPMLSDRPLLNDTTKIYYGTNRTRTALEDEYKSYVTFYNCTMLAKDCSRCEALNKTRFRCGWCVKTNQCIYRATRDDSCYVTECPAPTITAVVPRDGPVKGSTRVTIYGFNLGTNISEIESIKVAGILCKISDEISQMDVTNYGNFESRAPKRIICRTGSSHTETTGAVSVVVNGQISNSDVKFSFRVPVVTDIVPGYGPEAGGTRITIYGDNLGVGNRNVLVHLEGKLCLRPEVTPKLPLENITPTNFTIICTIEEGYTSNITMVTISIDNDIVIWEAPASFTFVANPVLDPISPKNAFLSGGTKVTIKGKNIDSVHEAKITLNNGEDTEIGECIISSEHLVTCKVPRASESLKEELLKLDNSSGQFSKYIRVLCAIHLDNFQENIEIAYYHDPIIEDLPGSENIVNFEADDRRLKITGNSLDHVATVFDITVTVGVESCVLVELSTSYITCIAPKYKPKCSIPNNILPEVNVSIGNLQKMVGYVEYESRSSDWNSSPVVILSATVACAVFILIISMATVLICRKYRRMKTRLRTLVNQNSRKEEDTDVIRFSRLAGRSSDTEYSELYNVISEPFGLDLYNTLSTDPYNTISADDIERSRRLTANDSRPCISEHLPETSTLASHQSQDTLFSRNKITVEIQLEGTTPTHVSLVSKGSDDQSYLHAVSGSELSN